jgi:hypothetical protein
MQINQTKLDRLEEKAQQAHAVLIDIQERHSEVLSDFIKMDSEFNRQYLREKSINNQLVQGDYHVAKTMQAEIEQNWSKSNPEIVPPDVIKRMVAIDELRAKVQRLKDESDKAQERWNGLNAYLPNLRKFAKEAAESGGY